MLYEIMKHIRNFFPTDTRESGTFVIEDGTISLPFVTEKQYFLIEGSTMNDGVYQCPVTGLDDETFNGTITLLAPPKSFLILVDEIKAYQEKVTATPFVSESFGGYSYTRATTASGNISGWQNAFGTRLNAWRKI